MDAESGNIIKILDGHTKLVKSASFNHDSTLIVSTSDDRTMRIWDINTGECINIIKRLNLTNGLRLASFNHDSKLILTTSDDNYIRLWDAVSGKCIKILNGHTLLVRSASFNHDSSLIVSSGVDATIRVWDTMTGNLIKIIRSNAVHSAFKIKSLSYNHIKYISTID